MTLENPNIVEVLEVLEIHDTVEGPQSGVYRLVLRVRTNGIEEIWEHLSRPNDPHGINPLIRQWLAANPDAVVHEYVPPAPPSDDERRAAMPTLTARQFRLGMLFAQITPATIDATIAAIEDPVERATAQIEWEYATQFERLHPLVTSLSAALGLTPEYVDNLWSAAAVL